LTKDGFTIQPDDTGLKSQDIKLFATHPKYPVVVHWGNEMALFLGVKLADEADQIGFEGFRKAFHEFVGSSFRSYLSFATPLVSTT
jgi:hypothetical protein